jgi:hypothetical protein
MLAVNEKTMQKNNRLILEAGRIRQLSLMIWLFSAVEISSEQINPTLHPKLIQLFYQYSELLGILRLDFLL